MMTKQLKLTKLIKLHKMIKCQINKMHQTNNFRISQSWTNLLINRMIHLSIRILTNLCKMYHLLTQLLIHYSKINHL